MFRCCRVGCFEEGRSCSSLQLEYRKKGAHICTVFICCTSLSKEDFGLQRALHIEDRMEALSSVFIGAVSDRERHGAIESTFANNGWLIDAP